ncbi:MAG TPA: hypothetical protein VII79_09250 [Candidatus Dormibacteraeota bacterium]
MPDPEMRLQVATRFTPILAAAIVLAVSTSGCGSSAATLDPVAEAAAVTSQVGGAHLALTVQGSAAGLSAPFTISGQGFFNYKTREGTLSLDMTGLPAAAAASLPSGSLHIEETFKSSNIYIGSPLFASTLPGGAYWMKLDLSRFGQALGLDPQQLAGGQSNPAQFLEYLKASGGDVTPVGHELVRGAETTHYSGKVDLHKAADTLPSANRAQLRAGLDKVIAKTGTSSVPVDVWVDAHQLVRRMTMVLSLSGGTQTRMTLELFEFGPTPTVTRPPENEVYDATQTALNGLRASGG